MTDPSLGRKKKKITYTASPQGVERADNALIRLGFDSKLNFAKSQLLARNTVTKFFQRQPIQLDSFKRICEALKLNWREIAEITEEEQAERLEINDCSISETNEEVEAVQKLRRQVTVIDKQSQKIKAVIVLEGDINSINNDLSVSLELVLRTYSGDTIKITGVEEGSIRIIVEGSQEDIERLISQFELGELTDVNGFPVENIQILSESSDDNESNELDKKWRLVQEIVSQPTKGRNLSGADLSDADLSDADLSGADLSDADLSGADLSRADLSRADLTYANLYDANLSGADLSLANLSGVNLSGADLSGADLSSANLSGADLSGAILNSADLRRADLSGAILSGADLSSAMLEDAIVLNALFGGSKGLTEATKRDLELRGAIFADR